MRGRALVVGIAALGWLAVGCSDGGAVCGDGTLEGGEECDDGNLSHGDGCGASCYVEYGWNCAGAQCVPVCGDGIFIQGHEVCDPSSPPWVGYCSVDCSTITGSCGDGILQMEGEDCDPGSAVLRGCDECQAQFGFTCGGTPVVCTASGLPGVRRLEDLTSQEVTTYCTWLIDTMGGPGDVYICGDYQITNNSVAQCVSQVSTLNFGNCTVADMEDWVAEKGSRCSFMLGGDPACFSG